MHEVNEEEEEKYLDINIDNSATEIDQPFDEEDEELKKICELKEFKQSQETKLQELQEFIQSQETKLLLKKKQKQLDKP